MSISSPESSCDLDSVLATGDLDKRPARIADVARETRVLLELTDKLAREPQDLFAKLAESVMEVTGADSAGVSLLNKAKGRFVWPTVIGGLASYVGAGTPSDFGPCGTVLDRKSPLLFVHPERHFTYLASIAPPLEEVLLAPFSVNGENVGTIWAVIHKVNRHFDSEDRRMLESLTTFAAAAYELFLRNGTLGAMMVCRP